MSVDRRSYAWWVSLRGFLEDAPPHFNGRIQRRFAFRTRAEAHAYFDALCEDSHQTLLEVCYPRGGTTRDILRWQIAWGANKEHDHIERSGTFTYEVQHTTDCPADLFVGCLMAPREAVGA